MASGFHHVEHNGIALLPLLRPSTILTKSWTAIMGAPPSQFDPETSPKAPMMTFKATAITIVCYYALIFGGREYMRNKPAYKLNGLFMAHNLFLSLFSAFLLACFAEQLIPSIWNKGLYDNICGGSGWTQPLLVLYYLNYLTKYFELFDTVFLFLKKKPLTFLHCYHHPATALLCYTQLMGHTPVSWVPITLNLFVHVVMYWYYFQSARGVKIWWKEWITRLQIAQFVIDLGFVYFCTWDYYSSTRWPFLPHIGTCEGEEFAAFAGCAILSSYLVLFISFYFATYKKSPKGGAVSSKSHSRKQSQKTHAQRAAADMKVTELPNMAQSSDAAARVVHAANEGLHKLSSARIQS